MDFLITAFDGDDSEALSRRMVARPAHLELGDQMRQEGSLLFAAAILDESDRMIGSSMVVSFPSRQELEAWLEREPYVVGGVWRKIDVKPCRPGPAFVKASK